MRRLIATLVASSFLVSGVSLVVSCENSPSDLYSTTSFGEKISSLKQIDSTLLKKNGVTFYYNYAQSALDDICENIVSSGNITNEDLKTTLQENMRLIVMSNEILFKIGKIPGYHWLTEKLRSQSVKFDLFNTGRAKGAYNNWSNVKTNSQLAARFISSYLDSLSDWGISVTFFNKDKVPWGGEDEICYFRINVNQKIVSDEAGYPDEINSLSNNNAVHLSSDGKPYQILVPISTEGYIYQGYVTGTDLISLESIASAEEKDTVDLDFISYTPSVWDMINTKIIGAELNDIIKEFRESEFDPDITKAVMDNPFYINDEDKNGENISVRLRNISFVSLFGVLITRHKMDDQHWQNYYKKLNSKNDTDKVKAVTVFSKKLWRGVEDFYNMFSGFKAEDENVNNSIDKDFKILKEYHDIDINDNSTSDEKGLVKFKSKLKNALRDLIQISRKNNIGNVGISEEEVDLANTTKIINVKPIFYKINSSGDLTDIKYLKGKLTEFGTNNTFNFGELIYSNLPEVDKNDDYDDKMAKIIEKNIDLFYRPDEKKNDYKISDAGFRNISIEKRFGADGFLSKYISFQNELSNDDWLLPENQNSFVVTGPLDPEKAKDFYKSNPATNKDISDPTQEGLINGSHIIDGLGLEGGIRSLTLSKMVEIFDADIRDKILSLFVFDDTSKTMPIWDVDEKGKYGLSADRDISGSKTDYSAIKYDENKSKYDYDDDLAFSDFLKENKDNGKNCIYPTAYNSVLNNALVSDFGSKLYVSGYNGRQTSFSPINPVQISIPYAKTVNSFGKDYGEAINHDALISNGSYLNSSLSTTTFVKTVIDDSQKNGDPDFGNYFNIMKRIYDYWVRCSSDVNKEGRNPNAKGCHE